MPNRNYYRVLQNGKDSLVQTVGSGPYGLDLGGLAPQSSHVSPALEAKVESACAEAAMRDKAKPKDIGKGDLDVGYVTPIIGGKLQAQVDTKGDNWAVCRTDQRGGNARITWRGLGN